MIDMDELRAAVECGEGYQHLTPGQAWAATAKDVPADKLQHPLSSSIRLLLDHHARKIDKAFRKAAGSSSGLIDLAYDHSWPAFLRNPVRKILNDGLRKHFPDLEPDGFDDDGNPLYSTAHMAEVFGVSEDDITDFAEQGGYTDAIHTGPVHRRH